MPPRSTIADTGTSAALPLLDTEAPPVAKTTLRSAVAVDVARHARATNYREDQGLRSQKLRKILGNAYPLRRTHTYQIRRGRSRLPASAAHVHTSHTAAGCVLQLQLVTVHVSPYPSGFFTFIFLFCLPTAAVTSPARQNYYAHGIRFVVPFLVLISSGACCKRCTAPMIMWTNSLDGTA